MRIVHGSRHHTIVVLDVEGFGDRRRTNPDQRAVRDGLYHVVRTAFDTTGVPWADCYHEDRGDAVFVLAPAEIAKAVFVESLPDALVAALRAHNDSHHDPQRIRLRMALHAGEVNYDDHGVTSASLILTFRLCDAKPLKAALETSPGVLALITSVWFFDDVVRHTPGAAPATYRPIPVAEKETRTLAWLSLPDHPYPPDTSALSAPPLDTRQVPRQLPLAVRDFTGRADQLAMLDALVPSDGTDPHTVIITAIDGAAGIGKTSLAVQWAHRAQHQFPDGTLHVNLRGYGPGESATPGEVLDGFLHALDTPADKIPADQDAKAALFRSIVDGRRMLIVLDNANNADQIRPLLPGTPGCMVLVTSRDSLTGLVVTEAAHRLTLDLLTPPEAHDLVTGILGEDRASAEPDAVTDLIRSCARLPLALRIAASKIAYAKTTVAGAVAELTDEQSRLAALSRGGDERAAVRTVFDWSYQRLPAEHAQLFRRLGLHPGPEPSRHAAAAVAELDPAIARGLLDDLADAHLIEPTGTGRYRMHDLLRAYAADQANRHDPETDREQALRRLLDWYAHLAFRCDESAFPTHYRLPLNTPTPTRAAPVVDGSQVLGWFIEEQDNLLAALHSAMYHELHQHVVQLSENTFRFFYRLGKWTQVTGALGVGIEAAKYLHDEVAETRLLNWRGECFVQMRRWDAAQTDFQMAMASAHTRNDRLEIVASLIGRARMYNHRDEFDRALTCLDEALPLVSGADAHPRQKAVVENNISSAYNGLGNYRKAIEHGERALAQGWIVEDPLEVPGALNRLAEAWQGLGEHRKAIELCRKAIDLGRTDGAFPSVTAWSLYTLGISLDNEGDTSEAIACWRAAAVTFENVNELHLAALAGQRLETALGDLANYD